MNQRQKQAAQATAASNLSSEEQSLLETLSSEAGTSNDSSAAKRRKTQSTLTENYVVDIPQAAKDVFLENFCRWVIVRSSTLSFNVAEDKLLKEAFQTIGLPPPNRKKISGKFLDQEFTRVVDARAETLATLACYQLAGDSWKSHYANDGDKIMAATVTLPTGGALVGGFQGCRKAGC
jgi:hypothetical protein